jgi:hypothetical protein
MPAERMIMHHVREVLRLKFVGGVREDVAHCQSLQRRRPPSCLFVSEVAIDGARLQGGQLLISFLAPLKEYSHVGVPPFNRSTVQPSVGLVLIRRASKRGSGPVDL